MTNYDNEMIVGTYNGKTLYRKMARPIVSMGGGTGYTTYTFPHGIDNIGVIVKVDVSLRKNNVCYVLPYVDNGNPVTYVSKVTDTSVSVVNKTVGWTDYALTVDMYYIKN